MAAAQAMLTCSRPVMSAPRATSSTLLASPASVKPAVRLASRVSPALPTQRRRSAQTAAALPVELPAELFQLAGEGGFIGGTAATVFATVLVGLAVGFVLLRVETLVEEGKIPID